MCELLIAYDRRSGQTPFQCQARCPANVGRDTFSYWNWIAFEFLETLRTTILLVSWFWDFRTEEEIENLEKENTKQKSFCKVAKTLCQRNKRRFPISSSRFPNWRSTSSNKSNIKVKHQVKFWERGPLFRVEKKK